MPTCTPELTPFVGDLLDRVTAAQLDDTWQERSAVVEFDAGLSRPLAESLALIELLRRHPNLLAHVQVLAVDLGGRTQWWLTDDVTHAQRVVADLGGVKIGCHSVADVVRDQFGGIALLGTFG
jgi:hypothetical protein